MFLRSAILVSLFSFVPFSASADVLELSQSQMRQLVVQQQVLSAETVVEGAARNFGGVVMDIRGFLSEGQMTYRLLLQRNDGSVVEVLVNGVNGQQVSHNTNMGQVVSAVAKSTNGAQNGGTSSAAGNNQSNNSANANSSNNRNSNSNASSNRNSNASSNSNRSSSNNRDNSSNNRGGNGNGNGKNK